VLDAEHTKTVVGVAVVVVGVVVVVVVVVAPPSSKHRGRLPRTP